MKNWPPYVPLSAKISVVYYIWRRGTARRRRVDAVCMKKGVERQMYVEKYWGNYSKRH